MNKKAAKRSRLPETDSIRELAEFWDRHDLTEFDDELEEVTEPVFERETTISVPLSTEEAAAIARMADAQGLDSAELIRRWVLQHMKTLS